jgi:plastocyanin
MMTSRRAMIRLLMLAFACAICCTSALGAADDAKGKDKAKDKPAEKSPTTKRTAKTHTITIENSKFSPAALTVQAGDTVIWKNDDDKDHTVIADDKSFKSDNISSGDDFKHTFAKAGTFKYTCKYHPREKATITVEK